MTSRHQIHVLSWLLTAAQLLLCAVSFCACGGGGAQDTKTESNSVESAEMEPEETETRQQPETPAVRYDGRNFRVLYLSGADQPYAVEDLWAESYTSEPVNDAVYDRNTRLEQNFDVKIQPIPTGAVHSMLQKGYTAGIVECEVASTQMNVLMPAAMQGALYDWNRLTYVTAAHPWWDARAAEDLSVSHHLFMMAGDVSMEPFSGARFLYYNKRLMTDAGFSLPYDLVKAGKWTFDAFLERVQTVSNDLNGDGKMDSFDQYGMLIEDPSFFFSGCGVLFTEKDEDDRLLVNIAGERTVHVLEKVGSLFQDKAHTLDYYGASAGRDTSSYAHIFDFGRSLFAGGQFLFVQNGAKAAAQFAAMEDPWGILPNPKLDETQSSYYHLVDPFRAAMVIPSSVPEIEWIDILLDNWSYLSTDTVRTAYYENTLKKRRMDAPEDAAMMDIIWNTKRFELSTMYDLGIQAVLQEGYKKGNLSSAWASREKAILKKLNTMQEKIEALS